MPQDNKIFQKPNLIDQQQEVGLVTSVNRYLLQLNGLPNVKVNEIILSQDPKTPKKHYQAVVLDLHEHYVEALLLEDVTISPGTIFTRTNLQYSISVGPHLLGRAINPLGSVIDGGVKLSTSSTLLPIYQTAGGIKTREFMKERFETGIIIVDMLVPIAKGQRELILGTSQSGKTGFILDTIINQKKTRRGGLENPPNSYPPNDVICVYGLIGKPIVEIRRIIDVLKVNKALDYTVIVATNSSDIAPLIYLTPLVSMTIAEYFQKQGLDVLLVLDDMGSHAKYYREISLLAGRSPARESYPSDIFSQHARLLERAGKFRQEYGGGSITALPVMEISFEDFTGFIQTNLMATTDGHLMFSSNLYHQGFRPAVDVFLSVSRVGKQTQSIVQKVLADKIKTVLANANRLQTLSKFGSEVSAQTRFILNQAQQLQELLHQPALTYIPHPLQIIMLGLVFTPFFSNKDLGFVQRNKNKILEYLKNQLNLEEAAQNIDSFSNEKELFDYINTLIPELEKICQTDGYTQAA